MAMVFLPKQSQPKQELQQQELQQRPSNEDEDTDIDVHNTSGTPVRYLPLHHLYSATSPCSGSTNVMSKKVKARKLNSPSSNKTNDMHNFDAIVSDFDASDYAGDQKSFLSRPPVLYVYSRRRRKRSRNSSGVVSTLSFYDNLVAAKSEEGVVDIKSGIGEEVEGFGRVPSGVEMGRESRIGRLVMHNKKRKSGSCELLKLGVDLSVLRSLDGPRLRDCRNHGVNGGSNGSLVKKKQKKLNSVEHNEKLLAASPSVKRWVRLSFEGVDSKTFIGLKCKVFWPMDAEWYTGCVIRYDLDTNRHKVLYEDGDEEELVLSNERIKFYISYEEMQHLHLTVGSEKQDTDVSDYSEMFVLAAVLDDCPNYEPGDILWGKLTGHTEWPAVVVEESVIESKGLKGSSGGRSIPVQFFGTYDFARIKVDQIVSFLKGLLCSFHLKSRKPRFIQGLEEAKMYLSAQRLPDRMLHVQKDVRNEIVDGEDGESTESGEDGTEEGMPIKLGKGLSNSKVSSKYTLCKSRRCDDTPVGYRPVRVDWKDLDKCSVCHMDEEYENNLFLQCDKCRMMVHARCYGELEPVNGVLWLCNLCRPGAPESPPRCCLCPVLGGAMKPTTDGRWAHLACAMWIPETCLSDVKRMEPIDGLNRINKDRWKLLCSICGVSYGACIQCSNNTCCVAYHPLCARAAGLCVELEDEDRLYLLSVDDDEDQCIRLLSFCKRHRPPSNDRLALDERVGQLASQCSDYNPPSNPSGCARSEPYNYSCRRGRKEPEALAAASLKRLFVENRSYLVGGYCQHESSKSSLPAVVGSKFSSSMKSRASQLDSPGNILSIVEKYQYMRETFRKRLAFGKSRIHGFGIFAKLPHRAGDMMIEYTGELVRPSVADRRERFIYNSLVGAGTYMFRIDDERVIDATRAGSIAHLINHSCEPNCYSRVISVNGDEHIIIFAKRDIRHWEELTYDYRFFSIDEQLACYCGFPRCRGIVNDTEAEERAAKLYAPKSELIDWKGE